MPAQERVSLIITARDKTRAAFRRVQSNVREMRLGLASLVASLGAGVGLQQLGEYADSVQNASERLGVNIERLQRWQKAARDFGIGAESLNTIFQRMRTRMGEAQENARLLEIFLKEGIVKSAEELNRLAPDEALLRFADAAKKANEEGRLNEFQASLARVVDTEGVRLLGFLREGSEGIRELLSQRSVASADAINTTADAAEEARKQAEALQAALLELSTVTLPALTTAVETFNEAIEAVRVLARGVAEDPSIAARSASGTIGASVGAAALGPVLGAILRAMQQNNDKTDAQTRELQRLNQDGGGLAP